LTPLKNLQPGQLVEIWSRHKRWLGLGYANPNSLICTRLITRQRNLKITQTWLQHRIAQALDLRTRFYPHPYYRLVFGESDNLPGLVADRYGNIVVLQFTTAGMEQWQDWVITAIDNLLQPQAILLRNDLSVRNLEGLDQHVSIVHGKIPTQVELVENDLRFLVSPEHGQKTGWFYDQRENRARLRRYVANKKILDVCSYLGGWGISSLAWNAREVLCVDSSEAALHGVLENAKLNNCHSRIRTQAGDAFEVLKYLHGTGEQFDVIILDPPAFIKRRKDLEQGTEAYGRLNQLGLRLLSPGGILISSSCSTLMTTELLQHTVQKAARRNHQTLQLLESGQQSLDHPIHPAIIETAYLKTLYFHVTSNW
jgi:23S rRNA (cytosine1962-C5)-methyltransferase